MKAILTYHSLDGSGSPISLAPEAFERHLDWLRSGAVRVLPLADLATDSGDGPAVALTFDDAFVNFAEIAWPRLRDAGLPVTLFVVSERCGKDNRWGEAEVPGIPTLPLLDWEALGRLAEAGVEIGAHSRTHPDLRTCPADRLEDEVAGSRAVIEERLGVVPRRFAYPYGHHDALVRRCVAEHFEHAVTVAFATLPLRPPPHALPRLDAWYFARGRRLEAFGSPAFARFVRARSALRGVRGVLRRARLFR